MQLKENYSNHSNPKFGFPELIDVPNLVASCKGKWFNQILCKVNNSVLRLNILQGEFHWHKHDEVDEFIFVLQGKLLIDLKDHIIALGLHQGYKIPKGVDHRTRAPEKAVIIVIESNQINANDGQKHLMENRLKTII